MTTLSVPDVADLRRRLDACPIGRAGWREYEDIGLAVLRYLFVPPLARPRIQARTLSGLDRRDAFFPNRSVDAGTPWGLLYKELNARLVLVEFKNFDKTNIDKDEVDQTRNYMKPATMGRLAIVCCNKPPTPPALKRRNVVFAQEEKVILFITTTNLKEMLDMKDRGEDPSDFIMDSYETFLIQHE